MLDGLIILLVFQLAGEALVRFTGLPLPGPVVGMVLLLLALMLRHAWVSRVAPAAEMLIRHLTLLFFPIGVGIVLEWDRFSEHGTALLVAVIGGTMLTLPLVALLMQRLLGGRQ